MSSGFAGNYDHPSYITHQMDNLGKSTAGSAGTSLQVAYPSNVRIRNAAFVVNTAGSTVTAAVSLYASNQAATTTTLLGTLTLGTSTANTVTTIGDLNYALANTNFIFLKNSADSAIVVTPTLEVHIDPNSGTWSGP